MPETSPYPWKVLEAAEAMSVPHPQRRETRQSACSPKTLQNDLRRGQTKRIQKGNKASQLYSQDITFYAV